MYSLMNFTPSSDKIKLIAANIRQQGEYRNYTQEYLLLRLAFNKTLIVKSNGGTPKSRWSACFSSVKCSNAIPLIFYEFFDFDQLQSIAEDNYSYYANGQHQFPFTTILLLLRNHSTLSNG